MSLYAFKDPRFSNSVSLTGLSTPHTMEAELIKMGIGGTEFIDVTDSVLPTAQQQFWDIVDGVITVPFTQQQIDKVLSAQNFNVDAFSQSLEARLLNSEFSNAAIRFEYGALAKQASFHSVDGFSNMKSYIQFLVNSGAYTSGDYDAINNSCKEQGVDLNAY